MVWTPEIPRVSAVDGDRRELVDRIRGILFSGAGKPDRVLPIFPCPAQDDPGSHHADRLFDFFRHIPATAVPMELCGRICVYRGRCIFYVL